MVEGRLAGGVGVVGGVLPPVHRVAETKARVRQSLDSTFHRIRIRQNGYRAHRLNRRWVGVEGSTTLLSSYQRTGLPMNITSTPA